ncbi:hypothetical protein AAF712_013887 [Marasmius tenuissimus]|uniref:CAP-Gly domain-containing protein n=1 Tax=Marasmius tenuissimus TaxID=585030 RepID=A0ABR2ZCK2_9AGAR
MLGFYGPRDYRFIRFSRVKVEDLNPSASFTEQLTDVSQVKEFELSDEAYAQRQGRVCEFASKLFAPSQNSSDSVFAYKLRHQVGRFAPKDETTPQKAPETNIPVGSECEVKFTEPGLSKRGTVRFVGSTKFGSRNGVWVGTEYDEPFEKDDGFVQAQGKRYFTCRLNYGVFARPDKVKVGDYPALEPDLLKTRRRERRNMIISALEASDTSLDGHTMAHSLIPSRRYAPVLSVFKLHDLGVFSSTGIDVIFAAVNGWRCAIAIVRRVEEFLLEVELSK